MFITALILVLALVGAHTTIINLIKRTYDFDSDHAVWFLKEVIKDVTYSRGNNWLNNTDFPYVIETDFKSMHTDEIKKQWDGILNMQSTLTQSWGTDSEGVAFYWFVCPWNEAYEDGYISMIRNTAKICLLNMHCTITDVVVDFFDYNIPNYRVCRIRYARTATEQLSFRNIQVSSELDNIGGAINEVHDDELDMELNLFG